MATLHVRNVPDELYARLRGAAQDSRRSMNAAVIEILSERLSEPGRDDLSFSTWLESTAETRKAARRRSGVSAADLIREDRAR